MSFARVSATTATGSAALAIAGQRLSLRADHSLWWRDTHTLLVADTHFGKAGVFRRRGVNVPRGTTDTDLARLTAALAETGARRLVVLGDFVHAPPAADEPWLARFAAWRAAHRDIDIMVTRGNHDRVRVLPRDLAIDWRAGSVFDAPFVLRHAPGADARGPVLAGHIHPVARLSAGRETLRAPVFWRNDDGLVLPAFSSFAGGARIRPAPGDRVFAVGDDQTVEVDLMESAAPRR